MASERGQASVEWTGLLLLVALGFAGLTALAARVEGRDLGAAVVAQILCAARGECATEGRGPSEAAAVSAAAPGARRATAPPLPRGAPGRRALPFVRRVAGLVARQAWIACLGYRRYRYEREHPRRLSPFEPMPAADGLEIANACLNPAAFLSER